MSQSRVMSDNNAATGRSSQPTIQSLYFFPFYYRVEKWPRRRSSSLISLHSLAESDWRKSRHYSADSLPSLTESQSSRGRRDSDVSFLSLNDSKSPESK